MAKLWNWVRATVLAVALHVMQKTEEYKLCKVMQAHEVEDAAKHAASGLILVHGCPQKPCSSMQSTIRYCKTCIQLELQGRTWAAAGRGEARKCRLEPQRSECKYSHVSCTQEHSRHSPTNCINKQEPVHCTIDGTVRVQAWLTD